MEIPKKVNGIFHRRWSQKKVNKNRPRHWWPPFDAPIWAMPPPWPWNNAAIGHADPCLWKSWIRPCRKQGRTPHKWCAHLNDKSEGSSHHIWKKNFACVHGGALTGDDPSGPKLLGTGLQRPQWWLRVWSCARSSSSQVSKYRDICIFHVLGFNILGPQARYTCLREVKRTQRASIFLRKVLHEYESHT